MVYKIFKLVKLFKFGARGPGYGCRGYYLPDQKAYLTKLN